LTFNKFVKCSLAASGTKKESFLLYGAYEMHDKMQETRKSAWYGFIMCMCKKHFLKINLTIAEYIEPCMETVIT
jgi:hypothetical protein